MRVNWIIFGPLSIWMIMCTLDYNEAVLFKLSNLVCKSYNESWVVINKCRLKAVSRNVSTLYFNGTFLHPVNDTRVQFKLYKKANGFKPWLYSGDINVCKFLKKAYNPVAILVFNLFKDFTNFNHTCPYVGTQIVEGFYLRFNHMPHAIPTGEYLLALTWLFSSKKQFITNAYFTFTEDLLSD